jgi:ATP/maltotriose-dependent transcriptional regulator MalT
LPRLPFRPGGRAYLVSMATDRRGFREILLTGLFAGALVVLLRLVEYRYVILQHSAPLYGGILAALFAYLGLRLGQKLTRPKTIERVTTVERVVLQKIEVPVEVRVPVPFPAGPEFVRDEAAVARLGITPRELEILELIAGGHSNREIAARVFVSENTVKTHSSRLFDKLNARRRTQAVQIAKELRLIP